jgi:signal peptide peptidase SppA
MLRTAASRLPGLRRFAATPVVPVLKLTGPIGQVGALRSGMQAPALAEPIRRAFSTPGAAAVALLVNSPGGSPVQSELIASRIRQWAEEKDLKVYAFCEDVAASGGYWLACAADEIYAARASIVGSIGVVYSGFGFQDLIRRYGIERRVHTAGEKKAILDPFEEEDPDDVAHLRAIQGDIHEHFKATVRARRQGRLNAAEEELFSGAFWTGTRAQELGLIDGIGELRQTLRAHYGEKVRLPLVEPRQSWLKRRLQGTSGPDGWPAAGGGSWAGDLLAAVEERALWGRYGL